MGRTRKLAAVLVGAFTVGGLGGGVLAACAGSGSSTGVVAVAVNPPVDSAAPAAPTSAPPSAPTTSATPSDAPTPATAAAVTTDAPTTPAPTTAAPTTPAPTTAAATTAPPTTPPTTAAPTTTTAPPPPPAPVVLPAPPLAAPITPLKPGAKGPAVTALQQRLLDLGFWIDEADGQYGSVTRQAVMAFQKHNGMPASGAVDAATADALTGATTRVAGQATSANGDLVEVDKGRQVLYLLRGGTTVWAFNISTGSDKPYTETNQKTGQPISGDAHTPTGVFKVYREYSDGWENGELGELYRPKYFKGGVAIHGHTNVPNVPASHGCVRVSVEAMDWMWANDVLPKGTIVWVHD